MYFFITKCCRTKDAEATALRQQLQANTALRYANLGALWLKKRDFRRTVCLYGTSFLATMSGSAASGRTFVAPYRAGQGQGTVPCCQGQGTVPCWPGSGYRILLARVSVNTYQGFTECDWRIKLIYRGSPRLCRHELPGTSDCIKISCE